MTMNSKSDLLLLSSSRVGDTPYLEHAMNMIDEHLRSDGNTKRLQVLFVPYAGVTISHNDYTKKVNDALSKINIEVTGIHTFDDPVEALEKFDALLIGGGNTFNLLNELYKNNLIEPIKTRINQGMKYIGWSAGSNIAGLTIRTTNDMPIIEPPSFSALSLVNIQLNPHYTDYNPPGHNGETREERINEFMILNPHTPVVGIVEGSALKIARDKIKLLGSEPCFIFKNGNKKTIKTNAELNEYL